ncbi:hypothetical protein [Dysosmobacter sp.]|uniref:hypothetical protein n=1 Tax=Dysosmobacter sp. TaxID=2591382 RepID=UPI00307CDE83
MKRTKRSSPFKTSVKAYIDKAQERNVPGLFLAGSFGKQGIAAENAGQTRVAAAEGETDGEFWRFNQQRMLVPHILKKLPKNEKTLVPYINVRYIIEAGKIRKRQANG